jgi:ribosome-associated translation inhibitor RaiA
MNKLEFTLEMNSEHLPKEAEYELFTTAETRLKQLAADQTDLVGAAINIRRPASGETVPLHEVTVVVYGRPHHISATQKEANPPMALDAALNAVERQIRDRREKLKKPWEQPGNHPIEKEIGEVIAAENRRF